MDFWRISFNFPMNRWLPLLNPNHQNLCQYTTLTLESKIQLESSVFWSSSVHDSLKIYGYFGEQLSILNFLLFTCHCCCSCVSFICKYQCTHQIKWALWKMEMFLFYVISDNNKKKMNSPTKWKCIPTNNKRNCKKQMVTMSVIQWPLIQWPKRNFTSNVTHNNTTKGRERKKSD